MGKPSPPTYSMICSPLGLLRLPSEARLYVEQFGVIHRLPLCYISYIGVSMCYTVAGMV